MSDTDHERFIIVFKDSATPEQVNAAAQDLEDAGGKVNARYDTVLNGFAASVSPDYFDKLQADSLQSDSIIKYIERDGIVTIDSTGL